MNLIRHFACRFARTAVACVLSALLTSSLASAQSVDVAQQPGGPTAAGGSVAGAKPKAGAGDADLRRRVEQLEEQLVDLQVVIGTLESLARAGGGAVVQRPSAPAQLSTADSGRIDALEMQIRALTSQIEQLSSGARVQSSGSGSAGLPPAPPVDRFGSTTVNSANVDDIGTLLNEQELGSAPPSQGNVRVSPADPGGSSGGMVADLGSGVSAGDPKQDYERAYGYLLQQNYGAAQAGFTDFLRTYPKDSLVPNALYWLGETHYVQRNYADAAEAFDLVMQGYGNSPKAADSMLKRSMALANLGKTKDACGLLSQLPGRYPSAPANLKSKADSERQRLGCP